MFLEIGRIFETNLSLNGWVNGLKVGGIVFPRAQ
jgi:hypothetical protein